LIGDQTAPDKQKPRLPEGAAARNVEADAGSADARKPRAIAVVMAVMRAVVLESGGHTRKLYHSPGGRVNRVPPSLQGSPLTR